MLITRGGAPSKSRETSSSFSIIAFSVPVGLLYMHWGKTQRQQHVFEVDNFSAFRAPSIGRIQPGRGAGKAAAAPLDAEQRVRDFGDGHGGIA